MKVLVACEFSGRVRDAFRKNGHYAVSCDFLAGEGSGYIYHYQGDVADIVDEGWDIILAFPPCTHLAASGARWFKGKEVEQRESIDFFMWLANLPIKQIAIENPIGIMSTRWRKPDQIIQPWQFGHGETKATCLWLKNLPKLKPTNIVEGRENRIHRMAPSPDRGKLRSITYQGIADAMADQWG
jgi:site-specific DNA-cytosine methylase